MTCHQIHTYPTDCLYRVSSATSFPRCRSLLCVSPTCRLHRLFSTVLRFGFCLPTCLTGSLCLGFPFGGLLLLFWTRYLPPYDAFLHIHRLLPFYLCRFVLPPPSAPVHLPAPRHHTRVRGSQFARVLPRGLARVSLPGRAPLYRLTTCPLPGSAIPPPFPSCFHFLLPATCAFDIWGVSLPPKAFWKPYYCVIVPPSLPTIATLPQGHLPTCHHYTHLRHWLPTTTTTPFWWDRIHFTTIVACGCHHGMWRRVRGRTSCTLPLCIIAFFFLYKTAFLLLLTPAMVLLFGWDWLEIPLTLLSISKTTFISHTHTHTTLPTS